MVVDAIMGLLTHGEKTMDAGGALARKGKPDRELVEETLKAPFFRQTPPRAAGRGEFGLEYAREFREQCRKRHLTDASTLATATWLSAGAVHDAYTRFILPGFAVDEVIVSGGGAHNVAMMEALADLFEDAKVVTSEFYGLDVDAKEAAAFALLAHLSLDGEAGNIPGVTGASHPVILGTLTPADVL
jgi:anhydro-N-acetylmuramic acid kinase